MNYKTISIGFRENVSIITFSGELENMHKGRIEVNEINLQKEAVEIAKAIKNLKGFKAFYIEFGEIDYYDNCNEYNIPHIVCTDDNHKVQLVHYTSNTIPKDWNKNYSLALEEMSSIRGFNKFMAALKINLDTKQLNKIRKAIKERTRINIDL